MSIKDLKKGIAINFVAKYSNILLQILIGSILARLLTPKEFGVVAVVMVFITFFNILGDMGIGPAVIQIKDISDEEESDIFIFTIFLAFILAAVFFSFSYVIAYIYDNTVYLPIGRLLSISIFFNVLNIVPNSLLLKSKNFKRIGMNTVTVNVLCGAITIYSAYNGLSYYSLVLNSIIQSLLLFSCNFYFSKIKIKFRYNSKTIKRIRHYSTYQFLFNFINYFSRNLDNITIGKFLGLQPLAYYDKAYRLMLYPVQNLTFVITPVLHPFLSEYQNDKDMIFEQYKKIIKVLSLIGGFATVFCYFNAREIILIMYGKQWVNSIWAFKILSLTICLQIVASSSGAIFQSTGAVDKLFLSGSLSALATTVCIIIGLTLGKIEYVAYGILIAFTINFFQAFFILIKLVFKRDYIEFIKEFKNVIVIMLLMVLLFIFTDIQIKNVLISLLYKGAVGLIGFSLGIFITKEYKSLAVLLRRN